jgi:hypothetical protein
MPGLWVAALVSSDEVAFAACADSAWRPFVVSSHFLITESVVVPKWDWGEYFGCGPGASRIENGMARALASCCGVNLACPWWVFAVRGGGGGVVGRGAFSCAAQLERLRRSKTQGLKPRAPGDLAARVNSLRKKESSWLHSPIHEISRTDNQRVTREISAENRKNYYSDSFFRNL